MPHIVSLATVKALHSRMLAHLRAGGGYELDAASVTELDAAGAQLLYAFLREATHHGATARWSAISAPLVDSARALGMAACLGLPEEDAPWQR